MRYTARYNRRIIDFIGFEPTAMHLDARYGGEDFDDAESEFVEELRREESPGR